MAIKITRSIINHNRMIGFADLFDVNDIPTFVAIDFYKSSQVNVDFHFLPATYR